MASDPCRAKGLCTKGIDQTSALDLSPSVGGRALGLSSRCMDGWETIFAVGYSKFPCGVHAPCSPCGQGGPWEVMKRSFDGIVRSGSLLSRCGVSFVCCTVCSCWLYYKGVDRVRVSTQATNHECTIIGASVLIIKYPEFRIFQQKVASKPRKAVRRPRRPW